MLQYNFVYVKPIGTYWKARRLDGTQVEIYHEDRGSSLPKTIGDKRYYAWTSWMRVRDVGAYEAWCEFRQTWPEGVRLSDETRLATDLAALAAHGIDVATLEPWTPPAAS